MLFNMKPTFLAYVCASYLMLKIIIAQQVQTNYVTCFEKLKKCELDCVSPDSQDPKGARPFLDQIELKACTDTCAEIHGANNCEDSAAAQDKIKCSSECSINYDAEMVKCQQKISKNTRYTYNSDLDLCSNKASWKMDSCMEVCYGSSRYMGWTPKTELGISTDEDELFKVPDYVTAQELRLASKTNNF
mmetsp:Transcript_28500/g.37279  ORF Transcript_28500/g.37279 Transcript_28500/m.37279 type:complete len:189 (+) Transcript_28500:28-594(+)